MRSMESPPLTATISMAVAPASSAFSTSSFTTLAGRSITSPAAMRLTVSGESWRMVMGVAICRSGRGLVGPRPDTARTKTAVVGSREALYPIDALPANFSRVSTFANSTAG